MWSYRTDYSSYTERKSWSGKIIQKVKANDVQRADDGDIKREDPASKVNARGVLGMGLVGSLLGNIR